MLIKKIGPILKGTTTLSNPNFNLKKRWFHSLDSNPILTKFCAFGLDAQNLTQNLFNTLNWFKCIISKKNLSKKIAYGERQT